MSWIAPTASFLEILLLLYVAMIDIATRLIRNEICLVLALLGIAGQFASPMQVAESLIAATILLLLLLVIIPAGMDWRRRCQAAGRIGDWSPVDGRDSVADHNRAGRRRSCPGASDDAPPAISQASARRIVVPTPRLRDRALAQFATRTATLRGCHSVRWYLDRFQPGDFDMSSTFCVSRSSWCCCSQLQRSGLLPQHEPAAGNPCRVRREGAGAPLSVVSYLVAARPLPKGTLAPAEDFRSTLDAIG